MPIFTQTTLILQSFSPKHCITTDNAIEPDIRHFAKHFTEAGEQEASIYALSWTEMNRPCSNKNKKCCPLNLMNLRF